MPLAKNKTFFYLLRGENVIFKLAPFDESFIDERRNIKQLAMPRATHISKEPFRGTNFKIMMCQGKERCHLCKAKYKPIDLFPVHILVKEFNWEEKIMDMQPSAHNAVMACVQKLLDNGATTSDIFETTMRLARLPQGQRPPFDCEIIDEPVIEEQPKEELYLSKEDMSLIERLVALVQSGKYKKQRSSIIRTLKEKYGWSDDKINIALEAVIDKIENIKD